MQNNIGIVDKLQSEAEVVPQNGASVLAMAQKV